MDASDEALRRVVFGRGSSQEQIRAASDELQRREARRRFSGHVVDAPDPGANTTADSEEQSDPPDEGGTAATTRSQRGYRGRLAVTALVGCSLGIAGTVGYYELRNETASVAGPGRDVGMSSTATTVFDAGSNRTIYQVPDSDGVADPADVDRWFAGAQTDRDALPVAVTDVDLSTSRHVGRAGADAGAWIARGMNGEYCAIIGLDDQVTYSSSCALPAAFLQTGTYVGMDERTMFWTPSTVIISVTRP